MHVFLYHITGNLTKHWAAQLYGLLYQSRLRRLKVKVAVAVALLSTVEATSFLSLGFFLHNFLSAGRTRIQRRMETLERLLVGSRCLVL